MGKPPAVVIVARHGARLDAADKQWHLTSPAPYDPPLTYSGWRQGHALGSRIASIIHHRETAPDFHLPNAALKNVSIAEEQENGHGDYRATNPRRRKHKVIIHTSPFLRCIQTSIAVSGGIMEAQGSHRASDHSNHRHAMHSAHPLHSGSPHIRSMNSPQLSAISEPEEESGDQPPQEGENRSQRHPKPHLRVDAFLGEWLSPGYFEDITHPPDSRMMVATAKGNLLHERNYEAVKQSVSIPSPSIGNFPGGWGSGKAKAVDGDDGGPLDRLPSLNQTLPRLNRSGSHSSAGSLAHRGSFSKNGNDFDLSSNSTNEAYELPIPSYAISPSAPIPTGNVAYAKAACLDVDYQWDSMRPPHEWGDGGQFGEEWSAMHKRFRRGLHDMLSWYRRHDNTNSAAILDEDDLPEDDDDEDTDTVLILVTHSAGCNALIGALTNQPVLLDAGMASLTMAVRKPASSTCCDSLERPSTPNRRRSSIDLGISEDYDVKIIASTDHLRPGSMSSSLRSSRASSPSANGQRFRSTSHPSTALPASGAENGLDLNGVDSIRSFERNATAAAPRTGLWTKPSSTTSNGLWSKPINKLPEDRPAHEISPLRESTTATTITSEATPVKKNERPVLETLSPLTISGGLWGAPPPNPPSNREKGPKRRWTLHEQR